MMTIHKKIGRGVARDLSFYVTGTVLTAITVMLLIGAFAVADTLTFTFEEYFAKTHVEDAEFTTGNVIPAEDIAGLEEKYNVIMEPQHYFEISREDSKMRIFSVTERVNAVTASEGMLPEKKSEIAITYHYAEQHGINVGDPFYLNGSMFTVSGLCMKPDYAIMLYDFNVMIADNDGFGIGIIRDEAMEEMEGVSTYYSVIYRDRSLENAFRKEIYETYGTTEYIERSANSRIEQILTEAEDLRAEFALYCPILLVVVVAVIAMVLAKKIKREGKNVGTLMALGYRKSELAGHYLIYGLIPAILGDVLGLFLSIPFSKVFCEFFFGDAEHIEYVIRYPALLSLIAMLLPLLAYSLVSWLVIIHALRGEIVPLLKGLKRSKTIRIMRECNAPLKLIYNIRSLFANGFRSVTMIIGIAVATLVIVLGGSFEDAYDNLIREKVPMAMMGGTHEYGFKEFQRENPYGGTPILDVSFGVPGSDRRFNLIGVDKAESELTFQTTDGREIDYSKYYMSTSAATQFGVKPGDAFTFYHASSMEETTVLIDGLFQNDIIALVVTGKENAAKAAGRDKEEFNVIISCKQLAIPAEKLLKNASLEDYQVQAQTLSSTAGIVLKLLKILGVLICILIVTMMSGMLVEESSRNVSMLRVLGYRAGEEKSFVLTSNHLLLPVGFVLGVPLGYLASYSMIVPSSQYSGMLMSLPVKGATILTCLAFLAVAYGLATLLAGRKFNKVDMVESLKCPLE